MAQGLSTLTSPAYVAALRDRDAATDATTTNPSQLVVVWLQFGPHVQHGRTRFGTTTRPDGIVGSLKRAGMLINDTPGPAAYSTAAAVPDWKEAAKKRRAEAQAKAAWKGRVAKRGARGKKKAQSRDATEEGGDYVYEVRRRVTRVDLCPAHQRPFRARHAVTW